ncbi:hypothetical protein ACFX12_025438 [Malus domestica]
MGLRRSMRQNATRRGAASSPRASTMGTTVMATSVATRDEVHGAFTTATMGTTAGATSVTARGEVHGAFTTAAMGTTTVATSVAARGEVHGAFTTAAMGTTTVATSVATHGEVHGAFTTARVVPSKFTWTKAQASHSHAPRIKQPAPVIQPALVAQPVPVIQPVLVAQPAPTIQPAPVIQPAPAAQPVFMVSQAAQVRPRQSQPSGPIIEAEAFSPHFSADLTFPNSNLALGVNHPFIVQVGAFHPSSSNLNGEQNLSRQVIKLTSALAQ